MNLFRLDSCIRIVIYTFYCRFYLFGMSFCNINIHIIRLRRLNEIIIKITLQQKKNYANISKN